MKTNYPRKFFYQDELSRQFVWTDGPSVCPYLYTDRLSEELPFFVQVRPRQMSSEEIEPISYNNWTEWTKIQGVILK